MQLVILVLVLSASISYACYRVWLAWKQPDDPCAGCDGCPLKDRKKHCDKKKVG